MNGACPVSWPEVVKAILSQHLVFVYLGHWSCYIMCFLMKSSLQISAIALLTREGGNYSDVLPLKAARRDSISNLTSFGASDLSCRQTQCRVIQSRCGAPC